MFRQRIVCAASVTNSYWATECAITAIFVRNSSFSVINEKFQLPARYSARESNIWAEIAALATDSQPQVNFASGFPDYPVPDTKRCAKTLLELMSAENYQINQYTRGIGHPRFVQALAKMYSPLINHMLNPMTEIMVTIGAYEALFSCIFGHVDNGQEVIIIEPFFTCYEFMCRYAGAVVRFMPLEERPQGGPRTSADWVLDEAKLSCLFNDNTKLIIMNTPNNPIGKVYNRCELEMIACLCKKHNVVCVADEVYEWMAYPPYEHTRMASLPGMFERTLTIGSAGKTFSVTGWKTGWVYGPENLMRNLHTVHLNNVDSCCTPIQEALAITLEQELEKSSDPQCWLKGLTEELTPKRDLIIKALQGNGFNPIEPQGGYFCWADWTKLSPKIDLTTERDEFDDCKFAKKFCKDVSVLTMPGTAFYTTEHKHLGEKNIRVCFIKNNDSIKLAHNLMREWNNKTLLRG